MGLPVKIVLARRTRCAFLRWPQLRAVLRKLMGDHGVAGTLGIAVVSGNEMQRLHEEHLGERYPTDVISFRLDERPMDSPDDTFGEVVVSADAAMREAKWRGLAADCELALYAIHGALHLVGYDDASPKARRTMRRQERKYLETFMAEADNQPRRATSCRGDRTFRGADARRKTTKCKRRPEAP